MLKKIFYIFLLFISIKATAQRTNSSPYSFFGIGQQYSSQTVEQATMGGIGIAFNDVYHLNFLNPAANANLRFATYSVGLNVNDLTIKDFSGSQKSTSTTLSYINIGFPIGKKSGASFGLKTNTSVGYSLLNVANDINGDPFEATRFYGSGGTNKIYGAYGISITKNFSVGLEAEYIFGKTENNILSQRLGTQLGTKNNEITTIRGTGVKLGLHYIKELKNKLLFNFGASFKLENTLKTSGSENLYSLKIASSTVEIPKDTLYSNAINGKIVNPMKTGLGFGFGKENKWFAGIEYEFQDALGLQGSILTNSSYKYNNSSRVSIGGFYLPKDNSISSYWNRVTYRAGVRFENTGLLVNGTSTPGNFTKIKDFGISFGLGLPLKSLSNLNLGFEYGIKGSTINNLIQENYFNFKLSLSLSAFGQQAWFIQKKID
ncbi:hypothetical protein KCTC32516_01366 [Polaribacter huanghezhanensis]|uniref:hypothetical protein n=1 Tax=Polaribacter huanghezhanensis TaxID=1354726 RepID=UPI0026491A10|nr:hypothetical protein [Polaribacter huanghezhanensis]WKD86015.1 hypothetical protein KCTC32516_01366 [Polaribacter huanghezhanensis]